MRSTIVKWLETTVDLARIKADVTIEAGRMAMLQEFLDFLYKFSEGPFRTMLFTVLLFVLSMFMFQCWRENQRNRAAAEQQQRALEAQRLADELAVKRQFLALLGTAVETRDPKTYQMMANLVESHSRSQALQAERPGLAVSWPCGALQLNSGAALKSTAAGDAPAVQ